MECENESITVCCAQRNFDGYGECGAQIRPLMLTHIL